MSPEFDQTSSHSTYSPFDNEDESHLSLEELAQREQERLADDPFGMVYPLEGLENEGQNLKPKEKTKDQTKEKVKAESGQPKAKEVTTSKDHPPKDKKEKTKKKQITTAPQTNDQTASVTRKNEKTTSEPLSGGTSEPKLDEQKDQEKQSSKPNH